MPGSWECDGFGSSYRDEFLDPGAGMIFGIPPRLRCDPPAPGRSRPSFPWERGIPARRGFGCRGSDSKVPVQGEEPLPGAAGFGISHNRRNFPERFGNGPCGAAPDPAGIFGAGTAGAPLPWLIPGNRRHRPEPGREFIPESPAIGARPRIPSAPRARVRSHLGTENSLEFQEQPRP